MKFIASALLIALTGVFSSVIPAEAASKYNWLRKTRRSSNSRQTMVAAVRGIDTPDQVDPNARDYESLEVMEKTVIPPADVDLFIKEGNLSPQKTEPEKPAAEVKP